MPPQNASHVEASFDVEMVTDMLLSRYQGKQLKEGILMAERLVIEEPSYLAENSEDRLQNVKDVVSDTAEKAQQTVEEVGHSLQNKIDESRAPAANNLQGAASKLHEKADSLPGGEQVAGFAHSAADKIEATAEYVRGHDVQDMMADLENFVRRHPGKSLMAAAALGFLLDRAFRSDD